MPLAEFGLIDRYFTTLGASRTDVSLGVGDDGAVLAPRPGRELVQVLDTIVEGTHFPQGTAGQWVGHRVLAVNLSDLAAMGAEPAWALLGLTLPAVNEEFLAGFAAGFDRLARQHGVALVGGDTTSGPLAATVSLAGYVSPGQALCRSGAKAGDLLWVSGTPGDAGAGLAILQGGRAAGGEARDALLQRFLAPEPRVGLGLALRGLAHACIDISDGLLADLGHLCKASGLGAEVEAKALPLSAALRGFAPDEETRRLALTAGDDYELLFAAPESATPAIQALATGLPLTAIGRCVAAPGIRLDGIALPRDLGHGFEHFGGGR